MSTPLRQDYETSGPAQAGKQRANPSRNVRTDAVPTGAVHTDAVQDHAERHPLWTKPPTRFTGSLWLLPVVAMGVVLALLVWTAVGGPLFELGGKWGSWATITVSIVLQAIPFLVLGVIISGVIAVFIPESFIRRIVPKNQAVAVPTVAACGVFLPGCECASVPVSQSFMKRGVPPAAALAFLLASPAINPVVLVATAVAYPGNHLMVVARLVASLLAAVVVGWVWMASREKLPTETGHQHLHEGPGKWELFRASALHDLLNAGGYLAFGGMIAALIQVAVPASWFSAINQYPILSVLLMAALAVLLSLCSEADAFVAASFTQVSLTAQLVFMVVGPMIDLKLIAMQYGAWGRRFVTRFVPLTLTVAILSAVGIGFLVFGGI